MRRMLTMMRKEFIHIFRDRRTIALVFLQPIMMLVLMGYAIAVDISNIKTLVYDQSNSAASRSGRVALRSSTTTSTSLAGWPRASSNWAMRRPHSPANISSMRLCNSTPSTVT